MRKLFPLFFLITTWAACVTVEFESPQPVGGKSLKNFPKKFQGSYINEDEGMLMIKKHSFIGGHKDSISTGDETFLDNNTQLRKIKGTYIINTRDALFWESRIVKLDQDSLFILEISGQDELAIKKIKDITRVKEIKNAEGKIEKYLINPSKSEFELLLRSDVFTPLIALKKVGK